MIKNILVAVDGSGHSEKAFELAIELAGKHKASLSILTAYGQDYISPEYITASSIEAMSHDIHAKQEYAEKIAQSAADRAKKAGIAEVVTMVNEGDAAAQILNAADKQHADTIVLGSHGHGTFKSLMLGSVSAKVAAHAKATCITVR
jgi:nucleotide-binding universal stress UspA family protein